MEPKRTTRSATVHIRTIGEDDALSTALVETLSVEHGTIRTKYHDLLRLNRSIYRESNHDELKRIIFQCLILLSKFGDLKDGYAAWTFEQIFDDVKKKAEGEFAYIDAREKAMKEGKE